MSGNTLEEGRLAGNGLASKPMSNEWHDCIICAIVFRSSVTSKTLLPQIMVNETHLDAVPPALIKLARKLMDLSQADLAKLAGVSLRTLVDVENEEREPMRATMARLRMSLEARGASFFGDRDRIGVRVVPAPTGPIKAGPAEAALRSREQALAPSTKSRVVE